MAYLRFPHLVDDALVFVADDDVWWVGAGGGRAERLTSDRVPAARPRLSPDGTQVAWQSRRDGAPEVYVAPVGGGAARRLTFWNHVRTRVLGWSADGRVVVATPAHEPFRSQQWAHALPLDGSPGERLPYGPIHGLGRSRSGAAVVQSVVFREPATWQRYRGGTAGKLWLDPAGEGRFARLLPELDGQLADPVWIGERILFVSDHEGHGNVYSVRPDGTDLRRHSDHTGAYARDLAGDLDGASTRLVYQRNGVIHVLDDLAPDAQPSPVGITLPGARAARQPTVVQTEIADLAVDHTGRSSLVDVRGTVQRLTHRDGPVRTLAAAPGVRARLPRPLPDGGAIWVTDADGDDALELTDGDTTRRLLGGQVGRVLELVVAPDGAYAAVATHDLRVLLVALADGSVRELERSEDGDHTGLVFSPDSAWLAWAADQPYDTSAIRLAAVATGERHDVTDARFRDFSPAFTTDGRYLAFLSRRTFDPLYDEQNFEVSFTVATRPYLVSLAADTPSPFDPEPDGRSVKPADEPAAADAVVSVRVDLDGLAERVVAAPVPAGLLTELRAAKNGLLWLDNPLTGVIGAGRPDGAEPLRPALKRWDFGTRRPVDLVDALDGFAVSGDGARVVVRDGDQLRVVPADRAVKDDGPDPDHGDDRVDVDLERLRVVVDPPSEWRQMLLETWRLMRDHFWVEDMGGVDWDGALARYLPLVDEIATRNDLSDVIWELIGELGASHAYERPKESPPPAGRAAAFLGADLSRTGDGRWRVDHVLPGESSVPAARSPLAGLAHDGDLLVSVNGQPVGDRGPAALLTGLAGKPVEVVLERDGSRRVVTVVPTTDETPIRYQDWVSRNRARVHAASGGRIGYVHVPDMVSTGWAEFNRDLRREIERDALVVDTRDNAGGHLSELVIERLSRIRLGGDRTRHGHSPGYPSTSRRGPMVSIADENAGSDGDIVNEAIKELGLGPIVGVRTWGGVIGIDGRYRLVDGTGVTQPRYSFWFRGAGWSVENHGVDPDVEVPVPPQAWAAGEDPQLDTAIDVLTMALDGYTPLVPAPLEQRPDRAAPPLPPR